MLGVFSCLHIKRLDKIDLIVFFYTIYDLSLQVKGDLGILVSLVNVKITVNGPTHADGIG